ASRTGEVLAASISERDIRIRRFGQNVRGKRDPPHFDRSRNPPRKNNFVATIARPWQGNRGQYAAIIFESGQTFREFRAWTMGLDPLKVQRTKAALVLASYPKSGFAASEAETWRLSRLAVPHACARVRFTPLLSTGRDDACRAASSCRRANQPFVFSPFVLGSCASLP